MILLALSFECSCCSDAKAEEENLVFKILWSAGLTLSFVKMLCILFIAS